jgi:hypothetical protein
MWKAVSHSGGLWVPTTLSRMIFSGQGAAMLITVWTSMATRMTSSQLL